jgi:hypothetical protein
MPHKACTHCSQVQACRLLLVRKERKRCRQEAGEGQRGKQGSGSSCCQAAQLLHFALCTNLTLLKQRTHKQLLHPCPVRPDTKARPRLPAAALSPIPATHFSATKFTGVDHPLSKATHLGALPSRSPQGSGPASFLSAGIQHSPCPRGQPWPPWLVPCRLGLSPWVLLL